MPSLPLFPTNLHQAAAEVVKEYFFTIPQVDTVLVVNSCARGQAVPESDLDFAILVTPDASRKEMSSLESDWQSFANTHPTIIKYKQSGPFAHLHLDIIDGQYNPTLIEVGEPIDFFEVEIGNQICYSAPMDTTGDYFKTLQNEWLPYYPEELWYQRLKMIIEACNYDINHIPFFISRELYFQAFDILQKAFQKYLQAVFMSSKIYPIAYDKWIKYQFTHLLQQPELYPKLPPILSISNIESNEINSKAAMLKELLDALC